MEERGSDPPLPKRVSGATKQSWPGTSPARPVLEEALLQRVRAAMDAQPEQAASQNQPASADDTMPIPVISGSASGGIASPPAGEAGIKRDRAARAERAAKAERAKAQRAAKAERAARAERAAQAERDKANRAEAERLAQAERAQAEQAAEAEGAAEGPADHRPAAEERAPAERGPEPRADGRKALTWRPYRLASASILVVVCFAAGWLALTLLRHATAGTARNGHGASSDALKIEAANRDLAAAWVFDQVRPDARVSCDPEMCLALEAHKVPVGRLLVLGTETADPLGSDVIVATAAVRSEFGDRLSSVYAPTLIASFGSGNLRIAVLAIAADGAAEYRSALARDVLDRKAAGAQLLQSPRIAASAQARKQLAAGQVDLRLLYTIADMAAQHPVNIVAFSDSAPGASAGLPLRFADLTDRDAAARAGSTAGVRSMLARLRAQGGLPYPYGQAMIVRLAAGQTVVRLEFAAPSPLGLGDAKSP
jgi:hypothetical protein